MIAAQITMPAPLCPGDTIALVSPSSKVKHEYIDNAAARLRSWGYEVLIGEHAYGAHGNFAGTPAERLADLQEALVDPSIKAILCTRADMALCICWSRYRLKRYVAMRSG